MCVLCVLSSPNHKVDNSYTLCSNVGRRTKPQNVPWIRGSKQSCASGARTPWKVLWGFIVVIIFVTETKRLRFNRIPFFFFQLPFLFSMHFKGN